MKERTLYIGLMSGTSADGLDAALMDFSGRTPQLLSALRLDFPASMVQLMSALRLPGDDEIRRLGQLDRQLGEFCALTVGRLLHQAGMDRADRRIAAIGWAGHTVRHSPDSEPPFTLQTGDPAVICQRAGLPVVSDMRRSDMAAGGQGAPLAPVFHRAFFSGDQVRAVVNLGGIANLSVLPAQAESGQGAPEGARAESGQGAPGGARAESGQGAPGGARAEPLQGFDTGPANCLMDEWAHRHLRRPMDQDGRWAASGSPVDALLAAMLRTEWLHRPPPKSTGRELFHIGWLDQLLQQLAPEPEPADVQATLALFTARTVVMHIKAHCPKAQMLLLCGGGVASSHLMQLIRREMSAAGLTDRIAPTDSQGLEAHWVEAAGIAWLARCRIRAEPLDMQSVTGGGPVLLGTLSEPVRRG